MNILNTKINNVKVNNNWHVWENYSYNFVVPKNI